MKWATRTPLQTAGVWTRCTGGVGVLCFSRNNLRCLLNVKNGGVDERENET